MEPFAHSGQGKLQTAPLAIREEVCQRLLNGEGGPQILPWLEGNAQMQAHLAARFAGAQVSDKNLTDFRQGYYTKWLSRRAATERQMALNEYSMQVISASGRDLSTAAAALAAGKIFAAVEALSDDETPPEEMLKAINDLRALDIAQKTLDHKKRELDLKEVSTAWAVVRKIKEALENRSLQAVADSAISDDAKMREFVRIAYGDDLLRRMQLADS